MSNIATPASQRLNIPSQGTVDSNGNCKISFNPPPLGYTFTGTVSVYDSPFGVTWNIKLSGQVVDVTVGPSSVASIQSHGADILTIEATGLNAYIGTTFHANYIAVLEDDAAVSQIIPAHDSMVIPNSFQSTVLKNNVGVTGTNLASTAISVNLVPGQPFLIFNFQPTVNNHVWLINITGDQSFYEYANFNFRALASNPVGVLPGNVWAFIPPTSLDTSVSISIIDLNNPANWSGTITILVTSVLPGFPNPLQATSSASVNAAPGVNATLIAATGHTVNTAINVWGFNTSWGGLTAAGNLNIAGIASLLAGIGTGQISQSFPVPFPLLIGNAALLVTNNFTGGLATVDIYFTYIAI